MNTRGFVRSVGDILDSLGVHTSCNIGNGRPNTLCKCVKLCSCKRGCVKNNKSCRSTLPGPGLG